jgi:hypothetical protein
MGGQVKFGGVLRLVNCTLRPYNVCLWEACEGRPLCAGAQGRALWRSHRGKGKGKGQVTPRSSFFVPRRGAVW